MYSEYTGDENHVYALYEMTREVMCDMNTIREQINVGKRMQAAMEKSLESIRQCAESRSEDGMDSTIDDTMRVPSLNGVMIDSMPDVESEKAREARREAQREMIRGEVDIVMQVNELQLKNNVRKIVADILERRTK